MIKYKYYFIIPKKKFKIIAKNNNLKNILINGLIVYNGKYV